MVYMKKPVLFYQFDEKEYRKRQYTQGYFDYTNNSFSNRFLNEENVLKALDNAVKNNFTVSQNFLNGHKEYFPYYDANNCERIYKEIYNLNEKISE